MAVPSLTSCLRIVATLSLLHCARPPPEVVIDARLPSALHAPSGRALLVFVRVPGLPGLEVNVADSEGRIVTSVPAASYVPVAIAPGQRELLVFMSPRVVLP